MEEGGGDPSSPAALLQNLLIASSDCFADSSHNGAARHASAQVISSQIGFYVACLLRGFEARQIPTPPNIVVVGAGFIGGSVIELLMSNGLTPFLHVFCRGDMAAQRWRRRGLNSSPSLARLMKDCGGKADVFILCSGVSGFASVTKLVLPFLTPATFVITSTFGLQRKRIFSALQTRGVFRTYLEPHALVKHVKSVAFAAGIDHSSFDDPALAAPGEEEDVTQNDSSIANAIGVASPRDVNDEEGEDEEDSFEGLYSQQESLVDSIKTYTSADQFLFLSSSAAGSLENAAEQLAHRTPDIVGMITVLENYFSLLGLRFLTCRAQALFAVLGYVENTAVGIASSQLSTGSLTSSQLDLMMRARGRGEDEDDDTVEVNNKKEETKKLARAIASLTNARTSLENSVSASFHRQISKHVRVVEIPRLSDLINSDEAKRASRLRRRVPSSSTSGLNAATTSSAAAAEAEVAREKGHGELNTFHPDSKILSVFSLDVRFSSPLFAQYDESSSVASAISREQKSAMGFEFLREDHESAELSLGDDGENEISPRIDPKQLGFVEETSASGLDPSVLLAIELAAKAKSVA